jgi:hypothetical protein
MVCCAVLCSTKRKPQQLNTRTGRALENQELNSPTQAMHGQENQQLSSPGPTLLMRTCSCSICTRDFAVL